MVKNNKSILLIYTGGTIGMINQAGSHALIPVEFNEISRQLPELKRFDCQLETYTFVPTIDSSDINPGFWSQLAEIIKEKYDKHDGFVILHGTDTMAYTASALSFMLENLDKPVILTGSQLPVGVLRTDGKENLLTAIEIAADKKDGHAIIPEVCIFFQNRLFRGNRTTKHNAEYFHAFRSYNYPTLADTGIHINYNINAIHYANYTKPLTIHTNLSNSVGLLKIFPGMTEQWVKSCLHTSGIKALVMETFGSGNAPTSTWFLNEMEQAVSRGLFVINVTQCQAGSVEPGKYETSRRIHEIGVINGRDITTESALTKLMVLLGKGLNVDSLSLSMSHSLVGEISL
ncbi:MAG: type I asparaginase [Bacteroidales bacterium]|nr:type I asparaginase [Bacteroidales bacterium]